MQNLRDCSIITLAHNGQQFSRHYFENHLKAEMLPRELFFIDNGSDDDTPALIEEYRPKFIDRGVDFISWRNDENLGCSLARNQAWEKATGKYVLFLDNDTAVCTANWLDILIAEMDADPKLGILGPKMIYPFLPHKIQCAGVSINPRGRIRFRGRGFDRNDPEYNYKLTVPALISACWIKRREFLESIGGLDELFHPVQYEDLDLCLRVNQAGYHCAYTPDVEMYHFEGKTTASFGKTNYQRNIAEQSMKFKERWKDVIKGYPEDDADYRWLADDELGLENVLDLEIS